MTLLGWYVTVIPSDFSEILGQATNSLNLNFRIYKMGIMTLSVVMVISAYKRIAHGRQFTHC